MQRLLDDAGLDPEHALLDGATSIVRCTFRRRCSRQMTRQVVPVSANIRIDLGAQSRAERRHSGVLPDPSGGGSPDIVKGTGAMVVESSVQTTNSWGLRSGTEDARCGNRAGRLLHARAVRGRRSDAQRMPEAGALTEAEDPDRGPQHRSSRLLARARILHAQGVRREAPSAVRHPQPVRQRLRRSLRGARW